MHSYTYRASRPSPSDREKSHSWPRGVYQADRSCLAHYQRIQQEVKSICLERTSCDMRLTLSNWRRHANGERVCPSPGPGGQALPASRKPTTATPRARVVPPLPSIPPRGPEQTPRDLDDESGGVGNMGRRAEYEEKQHGVVSLEDHGWHAERVAGRVGHRRRPAVPQVRLEQGGQGTDGSVCIGGPSGRTDARCGPREGAHAAAEPRHSRSQSADSTDERSTSDSAAERYAGAHPWAFRSSGRSGRTLT